MKVNFEDISEKEIVALKELYHYLHEDINYAKEDFEEGLFTFEEVEGRQCIWYINCKHDVYIFVDTLEIKNNAE